MNFVQKNFTDLQNELTDSKEYHKPRTSTISQKIKQKWTPGETPGGPIQKKVEKYMPNQGIDNQPVMQEVNDGLAIELNQVPESFIK